MLTNIYPIEIPFDEFNISRIPYREGLLSELRKSYNTDYSFFCNGNFIYISPDNEKELGIGESLVTLKTHDNEEIVSSLIKHIFFRDFYKLFGQSPLSFYPLRFISRKHDIIEILLPNDLKGNIGYKRQVEVQFRQLEIKKQIRHCAVYNIDYKWVFQKNCLDLYKEDFNLTDLDVIHSVPIPNAEKVLTPEEKLIGTVLNISVENSEVYANVTTNKGIERHNLDELFLEKSRFNIEKYLIYKLGKRDTDYIFQTISEKNQKLEN